MEASNSKLLFLNKGVISDCNRYKKREDSEQKQAGSFMSPLYSNADDISYSKPLSLTWEMPPVSIVA